VNREGVLGGLSLHFCPGAPKFQVTPLVHVCTTDQNYCDTETNLSKLSGFIHPEHADDSVIHVSLPFLALSAVCLERPLTVDFSKLLSLVVYVIMIII